MANFEPEPDPTRSSLCTMKPEPGPSPTQTTRTRPEPDFKLQNIGPNPTRPARPDRVWPVRVGYLTVYSILPQYIHKEKSLPPTYGGF